MPQPPRNRRGRYQTLATQAARRYSIPPRIFYSLIDHESGWNPSAHSSAGAVGLTQLMPRTAAGMGVDPLDPKSNLDGGARYLSNAFKHYGNWRDALRAYNYGYAGADEDPSNGAEYADSIMHGRSKYRARPVGSSSPGPRYVGLTPVGGSRAQHGGMSFADLVGAVLPGDEEMLALARQVDIPDHEAVQRGLVDTRGSVKRVSLAGSGNAMNVIGEAQSQLGKPYVFGSGPDTSSFDCSDLIQWAYGKVGIKLPRTTFEQIHVGRAVKWADLQPGDLIFPTGHHVVMYVGHGKVIAAPHTGTVVQYQPVSDFSSPVAIRRVL